MRNARRVLEAFVGACVIYTVMAACNAGSNSNSGSGGHATGGHGHGGSAHGGNGTAGMMAGPGGSDGSGIFDALTDPVRDAMADPVSGTRLKAAWIESLDGARQYLLNSELDQGIGTNRTFNVWFDSMRNEQCVFRLAADGKIRCLPGYLLGSFAQSLVYQVAFADATCAGSAAYILLPIAPMNCASFTPPDYGLTIDPPPTTCQTPGEGGRQRVFKTGAQLNLPTTTPYYLLDNAGGPTVCRTSDQVGARPVYAATEVDASKFEEVNTTVKHE